MNVRIMTDSGADLTREELTRLNITCVPMEIAFGQESFSDGRSLTIEGFWEKCMAGMQPKTSQPAPDAYLQEIEKAKAAGEAVVLVTIASALSGTMQSAVLARSMAEYEPVYIVDSMTAALGQKIVVMEACRLRDEGLDAAEIAEKLEAFRHRVKLYACLDTLEYLARGGRIPRAAAGIGALVRLKPLITLSAEGKVSMCGKSIGRSRAVMELGKLAEKHTIDAAHPVLPIYSYNDENCRAMMSRLSLNWAEPMAIGATIGTHIGPNAFGLVLVEAE